MPLRFFAALCLIISPLLAQRGDKPGEPMPAPTVKAPPAPALPVEEALKTFKIAEGFRLEVVAADPLVSDPVAVQFGPDGRLWVLEMRGFMPNVDGKGEEEPVGDVVVLTDTDGDGRMDKRTVFLDRLVLPRAISLVGDGLLVAEPTHLWYCRDTDGDGAADQKTEIAADYGDPTNPEHSANGLMWAMDNWIYSANHKVRFRYEGGAKFSRDNTIPHGQWGITQDDIGRLYSNSNSDPLRVDLIPPDYLERNRRLMLAGAFVQIAPPTLPIWPGRVTPGVNRGFKTLREDGTLKAVTAACAPIVVRSPLFPADFAGNVFICEPAGNLVKRVVVEESEGTLKARNAYEGTEFLTSTDERFRPVNLSPGPDGAIYLVDMYRGVIQHARYVTTYLRKQVEERQLEKPLGMGRIYRLVPVGAPKANFQSGLATASVAELVQRLGDANGWTRDTAQRLLVEKRFSPEPKPNWLRALFTKTPESALREFAGAAKNPLGRLHALWTLEGRGELDKATVLNALASSDPRICAAGIRLAEKFFTAPVDPEIFSRVAALAARTEPAVRLQLALSLGEAKTPAADAALRSLLIAAGNQPLMVEAVASSFAGREIEFIEALAREAKEDLPSVARLTALGTTAVLKLGNAARINKVLALVGDPKVPTWTQRAVLDGVDRFIPKMSDGRLVIAPLAVEPKSLIAFATQKENPEAARAEKFIDFLRWPGKPGLKVEPVKFTDAEQALFDKGKTQFAALCAACHQPEGQGLAGLAPPLVNSRWVLEPAVVGANIVLNGKAEENMIMPGLKAVLDDESIAAVLTYVRNSWGHTAGAVTPATVTRARTNSASREEAWSNEDLEELLQDLATRRRGREEAGPR